MDIAPWNARDFNVYATTPILCVGTCVHTLIPYGEISMTNPLRMIRTSFLNTFSPRM